MKTVNINLLPGNLVPGSRTSRISKSLVSASVVLTTFILTSVLALVSLFVLNHFEIKSINRRNESLKNTIGTLETLEKSYILLKDRVGKAGVIFDKGKTLFTLSDFATIKETFSDGGDIEKVELDKDLSKFTFLAKSSLDIRNIINALIFSDFYKQIFLTTLNLNPTKGYSFDIEALGKK